MLERPRIIDVEGKPSNCLVCGERVADVMQNLRHYIQAFSSLHTARVKGYKAPHKAILLLSIIDLVEEGCIVSSHIELTDELEMKFRSVWHRYLGNSVVFSPDITKPYFHMQYESFWLLVKTQQTCSMMVAGDGASNIYT